MKNFSPELIEIVALYCQFSLKDLSSLCCVSSRFYSAVIRLLYKNVIILGPRQYLAFKQVCPELKALVHRLDLSGYSIRGTRWSEDKAKSIIVTEELTWIFNECPQLKELCVGEELMEKFVSPLVLKSAFQRPLRTLDLTGFSNSTLTKALTEFFDHGKIPKSLENISFHMGMAISRDTFLSFFDRLTNNGNQLKKLDLAYTQINNSLFSHLQSPSTLTHLNLQGCRSLTCCSDLISYLESCRSLVQLNIHMTGGGFCRSCLDRIFASLSPSLESLDLGGHFHLNDTHIHSLPPLKYLSLAHCRDLSLNAIADLIKSNQLFYLNLECVLFGPDLYHLLDQNSSLKVIEISTTHTKGSLTQWKSWKLIPFGRRLFYCQVDPIHVYSKKIIMGDPLLLSPMYRYWCYSC